MEKRIYCVLTTALGALLLSASPSFASLGMPGDFQDAALGENVPAGDWTPATAPVLTETAASSGVFSLDLTGLEGPGRYQFKILDDEGNPPFDWGTSAQLTPKNSWFLAGAAGSATISIDTNSYDDGFLPAINRITASTDATEVTGFFATGNWMNEAGGAADWDAGNLMFQMTDQGSGLYSANATINAPGVYEWKATKGDFDGQWGTDGRNVDAAAQSFNIVEANQDVTFLLDISKGAISFQTATFTPGDTNNDTFVTLDDFLPIKNNFLNSTFLRSEGDLNGDGIVNVADFHEWKSAYQSLPGNAGFVISIPEPGCLALLAIGCVSLMGRTRKRA